MDKPNGVYPWNSDPSAVKGTQDSMDASRNEDAEAQGSQRANSASCIGTLENTARSAVGVGGEGGGARGAWGTMGHEGCVRL